MVNIKNITSVKRPDQFEQVFRELFIPLTHYTFKFVKDMDSSKEIVHSVFIKLWEKRNEMHSSVPVRSYLFTAVKNRALNYLRDRSKFSSADTDNLSEIPDPSGGDFSTYEESEIEIRILREIDNLPERCGEVFKLARFEGLKYKEIAERLSISVKTVEAQMSKALKILRSNLSDIINMIMLWIIYFFYNFL